FFFVTSRRRHTRFSRDWSSDVCTSDLVCARLVEAIEAERFDAIICNFATPDMVGHTGVLSAAITAVETVDRAVGEIVAAVRAKGGELLVTADHGNCEMMRDPATGEPHTSHTVRPVDL